MGLDIDGFAILGAIAANQAAFPSIAAEAPNIARGLVVKQLRSKTTNLSSVRDICVALGPRAFNLVLDGLTGDQIKALVGKMDKHNPDLKAASPQWHRQRMRALAEGSAEPTEKAKASAIPRPDRRKLRAEKPSTPERLSYKSAGAKRNR